MPLETFWSFGQTTSSNHFTNSHVCIRYWGSDCGPWIQALHFSYALGAFIVCHTRSVT